jgi:atypical dual specificity phosphatase
MDDGIINQIKIRARLDPEFSRLLYSDPLTALKEYNLTPEQQQKIILPNFSWVIEDKLAGMGRPNSETAFAFLKDLGVSNLITLTQNQLPFNLLEKYNLRADHYPVEVMTAPSLVQITQAVSRIDYLIGEGKKVVVHCAVGVGRTGTILACYLVSQGLSAREAISQLRQMRPGSVETNSQEAVVYRYEQQNLNL